MYFLSCPSKTRCGCFLGIINFFKKLISSFDIPDLISSSDISAFKAASSCFKKCKTSSVLTL